jgi:hypothetical protein
VLKIPDNVVLSIPVIVPEGVPLHDEASTSLKVESPMQLVVAVDFSESDLLHDPRITTVPLVIKNKNSSFFIITSLIKGKCRLIPTFLLWAWWQPVPELLPTHIIKNNSYMNLPNFS